jgi:hypothetical protein
MKQIPANSNDATMGHKLQGTSKDVIVITSWPTGGLAAMLKNWEYVVLSQVRTLSGLYLVAWLGNPFGIPQNSAINPIPDLLNSGIFIRILFF